MSPTVREIFAVNLRKFREQRGLKREELSVILGYDNSYISKVENCRINITIDKIEQIANYLSVEPYKLFLPDEIPSAD